MSHQHLFQSIFEQNSTLLKVSGWKILLSALLEVVSFLLGVSFYFVS